MLQRHPWLASVLVLLVASSFATGSTLARIAYSYGTDAISVSTARVPCAAVALWAVLALGGTPIALPARDRIVALGLGIVLALYSVALYIAIGRIPVALAVLVFYTYPLLTGVVSWLAGETRPTARSVGALLVAFIGLALALDPGETRLDPVGVLAAAAAALGFTSLLALNTRLFKGRRDTRPVTLHMLVGGSIAQLALCFATGGFTAPYELGWLALAGVAATYVFAMIALWAAVAAIGALRTALLMNFEPIASLVLGFLILGQHLAPIQLIGAALVIGAITSGRAAATPPPERPR